MKIHINDTDVLDLQMIFKTKFGVNITDNEADLSMAVSYRYFYFFGNRRGIVSYIKK